MDPRDPTEPHRAATPLELLFDLVFVVAVSTASERLGHAAGEGHLAHALGSYLLVFFAIWWAWLNFTWFASAYDTDDVPYRLMTLLQMTGALVLAAGVGPAFDDANFTVITAGYVIMRLAMVGQWLRAARSDPAHRVTAHRYAAGVLAVQLAWVVRLTLPASAQLPAFFVLVALELAVPAWAERAGVTPYHREHIAERYGLFTLIVLGETILASTRAVVAGLGGSRHLAELGLLAVGALVLVFAMWWTYFDRPQHHALTTLRSSLGWGYGHYLVFASAGAFSAGVEAAVARAEGHSALSAGQAAAMITVPSGVFLLVTWWLCLRVQLDRTARAGVPGLAALLAAAALLPLPVARIALVGAVVGCLVVVLLVRDGRPGVV